MIDTQLALNGVTTAVQYLADGLAEQSAMLNTLSLRVDSLAEANFQLQAQNDALRQENAALKVDLERLKAPPTPVDPWAKVDKTGATDVTAQVQALAIDGGLRVPAGKYLINSLRVPQGDTFYGLLVGSGKRLEMDANAVLVVKPNAAPKNQCVRVVDGGVMVGGQVLGDRDQHRYTVGATHEQGYCVFVAGAGCKVLNVAASGATGDNIGVTGPDHEIAGVVAKRSRRNGLSAFRSANLWIHDCEFSETGYLTDTTGLPGPFAGIDVEPDKGSATGIKIERVKCLKNQKAGIALWVRDEVTDSKLEVTITDCEISGSPNAIWGNDEAVRAPTIACSVMRNKLQFTSGAAVKAGQGSRFVVGDADPANANTIDSATGSRTTAVSYGIQERGGVASKGVNTFV